MAEQKIGIVITGNAATAMEQTATAATKTATEVKSAKQELRELTKQMADMDVNSKEFATAATRAGQLKDQLNDAADAVKGSTGPAFESMNNTFGVMQGQLANLDFDGLGQSLTSMGRAVGRISFQSIKQEIGGLIKGLGQLAIAVVTNPFLLIGAALAAIAMNWKEISAWINQTSIETQALSEATKALNDEYASQLQSQSKNIAQIQALTNAVTDHNKTEDERRKALKALQELYPDVFKNQDIDINNNNALRTAKEELIKTIQKEAKAKAAQALLEKEYANQMALAAEDQANRSKVSAEDYAEAVETYTYNQQTLFKETNQATSEWMNSTTAGMGQVAVELQKSNTKIAYLEQLASDNIVAQAEASADQLAKQREEDENKKREEAKAAKAQRAKEHEAQMEANAIAAAKELDYLNALRDEEEQVELDRRKAMYEKEGELQSEAMLNLGQQREKDRRENFIKEIENQDKLLNKEIETTERKKTIAKGLAAFERELSEKRLMMAQDAIGALMSLNEAFGKKGEADAKRQFKVNKAFSLAQAIISTYLATNNALTAGGNPAKLATGEQFVEAGIALTAGLANVVKIAKTEFSSTASAGGGGSISSGGGGGTSNQPNPLSFSFLGNRQQQQPPIQAYVVSGQVNTSIEAQTLIRNQAKLH